MTTKLPTKAKFLVSDDVRIEANAKISVVGLFVDDKILVTNPPGVSPPVGLVAVIDQLCIACFVYGGSGVFPAAAKLTGPSGKVAAQIQLGNLSLADGATGIALMKGPMFKVAEFGEYSVTLMVGAATFNYKFSIMDAQSKMSATKRRARPAPKKKHTSKT